MTPFEAALFYLKELDLSIVPIKIWWSDTENKWIKAPPKGVLWKKYQEEKPSEEEVTSWFSDPKNQIAIVTGEINNLYVFDLDFYNMSDEQKELARNMFPESFETLMAETPSLGNHYYCSKPKKLNGTKIPGFSGGKDGSYGLPPWVDLRGDSGLIVAPPSQRPDGKSYRFFNVQVVREAWSLIQDIPNTILNILLNNNKYSLLNTNKGEENHGVAYKKLTEVLTVCLQDGKRNWSLNKILYHAYRGGLSLTDGTYLAEFIGNHTMDKENKRTLKMDQKTVEATNLSVWQSVQKKSMAEEVKDWVCLQSAYFLLTDLTKYLESAYKVLTREDKKNIYVIMNRLVKEKIVEKHPNRAGMYRKIDTELKEIDLTKPKLPTKNITWPLGFHDLVNIKPKNVIIIWSGPDGGKSAFCFYFCMLNSHKHHIYYFSSEMGEDELTSRLEYFNVPLEKFQRNIHFFERSSNFADVIKPNEINIIDYLEVHEDFSLVAKFIGEVWKNLDQGIALICLQSKYNSELPRGGEFALEKARLAFSLGYLSPYENICKIRKAKNWKDKFRNPNGLQIRFKIVEGCRVFPSDGETWYRDSDEQKKRDKWDI